jgi:hypothetical protein
MLVGSAERWALAELGGRGELRSTGHGTMRLDNRTDNINWSSIRTASGMARDARNVSGEISRMKSCFLDDMSQI